MLVGILAVGIGRDGDPSVNKSVPAIAKLTPRVKLSIGPLYLGRYETNSRPLNSAVEFKLLYRAAAQPTSHLVNTICT